MKDRTHYTELGVKYHACALAGTGRSVHLLWDPSVVSTSKGGFIILELFYSSRCGPASELTLTSWEAWASF